MIGMISESGMNKLYQNFNLCLPRACLPVGWAGNFFISLVLWATGHSPENLNYVLRLYTQK